MRRRLLLTFAFGAVVLAALFIAPNAAGANATDDAVYRMLRSFDSPLAAESYTVVAFWRAHPEFDIVAFYAVIYCESSLGKGARHSRNVGSIKGGKVGTLWRDLRTGTFGGGYNVYPTWRDGQRAALRLILERYDGSLMRGDGLRRYWGVGVPGFDAYRARVLKARALIQAAM